MAVAPDYTALLANYPGLRAQIEAINQMGLANAARLTETRRRSLAQFGEIPDAAALSSPLVGNVNADINQVTRDLAQQATQGGVSTVAGLQRQRDLANQGSLASLAARGLLRSGATAQHLNENLGNYQRSLYGANQALQDQLGQAYQSFQGQQAQGQQDVAAATQKALEGVTGQVQAGLLGGGGTVGSGPRPAAPAAGSPYPKGFAYATAKPQMVKPAAPSVGLRRALRFG